MALNVKVRHKMAHKINNLKKIKNTDKFFLYYSILLFKLSLILFLYYAIVDPMEIEGVFCGWLMLLDISRWFRISDEEFC